MKEILNTWANDALIRELYEGTINAPQDLLGCHEFKEKKDITKLSVYFTNGRKQVFDIPLKRVRMNDSLINKYEELFDIDEDLGIIITDKDIK